MSKPKNPTRPIYFDPENPNKIEVIDQRQLPHTVVWASLQTVDDVARAIQEMWIRGAPLIGVTAAFGVYFACCQVRSERGFKDEVQAAARLLGATRPTAVNLHWAIERQMAVLARATDRQQAAELLLAEALEIIEDDVRCCSQIGDHGLALIEQTYQRHQRPVQILTHCNAGWVACVEWGTATAPIYKAHRKGIPVHVWVDETRPRNQGAKLTAWELGQAGIQHTLIVDNCGGHLMQHGQVDLVFVGSDRTTRRGDVANKIGTYLKALAARDNNVPFYVALPSSTIDWQIEDGLKEIPIEQRSDDEVLEVDGWESQGGLKSVRIAPFGTPAANYGFDVTPHHLITGLITERGIAPASAEGLSSLFPERALKV